MNRLTQSHHKHHVEIEREADDDPFCFEPKTKYNPFIKCPTVSPSTPQFDKIAKKELLRFKLPNLKKMSKTPSPRRLSLKHRNSHETKKPENADDDLFSFSTPKKQQHMNKNNDSSSKHRLSSCSVQFPNTPIPSQKIKRYKTIFCDNSDVSDVLNEAKREFKTINSIDFSGDVIFILKGNMSQLSSKKLKKKFIKTMKKYGFTFNQSLSSSSVIYCEGQLSKIDLKLETKHENLAETKTDSILEPKNDVDSSSNSNTISQDTENVSKTTVSISSISKENAIAAIKRRLLCPFNGIVVFKPINGKFDDKSMNKFPSKIIEICNEFGFSAHVEKEKSHTVQCDMRVKNDSKETNAPIMSLTVKTIKFIHPNQSQNENTSQNKDISLSENDDMKSIPSDILTVQVPWNCEKDANSLIKSHLSSDFKGIISFVPSIGIYSVVNMGNYPDRIVSMCKEYNFQAIRKRDQIVDCIKSDANKNSPKIISLESNDRRSAEQIVRNQLESGRVGLVQFVSDYTQMIIDICREYNFSCKSDENHTVTCRMTQRKHNELYVKLPSDNTQLLKVTLQRYIESGFIGKLQVSPENSIKKIDNFTQVIVDILNIYGFQSKVIDFSAGIVRALINPQFYDLSSTNDDQLEQKIQKLFSNSINGGFVVFSVKRPSMQEMKRSANKIVQISKSQGFPARISEFYYQRVFCNATSKNKKIVKNDVLDTNGTKNLKLPTYDKKTAELIIRKVLTSNFSGGTIVFSPKNGKYSQVVMAEYPRKIIEICSEYGYIASMKNQKLQIVECKMKKQFS